MRLFLTLVPDTSASDSGAPAASGSDPPSRVVLALPAAASAAPSTIHHLATLIASRFSLALHPAHPVPRLYLSNDFLLPATDPVADLLQPGDQVTVRYVPRPPGRRLPLPTADELASSSFSAQPLPGKKRKRSSYSVSESSSDSDSKSNVPARPRGPSLKRRRNAVDPLPSLAPGSAGQPSQAAAVPPEADPLLVHQIAETVTRRIAGLIESVLPTQEPMRQVQSDKEDQSIGRKRRQSAAKAASKLQVIESDSSSESSMDSDYEAISADDQEDYDDESDSEVDHFEEEEAARVDPFEDEADADPFEGGDLDPFDDDEDGDGDVTPTGNGLMGTFVDSDSDHSEDDADDDDDSGDDDLELQAYLESQARAAQPKPKRPISSPSTMMGLFGPMGQGPAGMGDHGDDSSDDGVSQAFDNLLARINVSVTSRGNSGSDTTSDSDSSSDSDESSSSSSSSDQAFEASNDSSSSSDDDDAQSKETQASSSGSSDSDSGPDSAPIATATNLKSSAAAVASARSPSPTKPAPASPQKHAASPAKPSAPTAITRPGRIWATAVDLAHFPAKRVTPSMERVQLAKAHNAAVANGSATKCADPSLTNGTNFRHGDAEQEHTKKTRRGKRGRGGRAKHGDDKEEGQCDVGGSATTLAEADTAVEYSTCAKLTPTTRVGMPAGSRIAFKRMQLSAQCTPEVSDYVEYEVVSAEQGASVKVVPIVSDPPKAKPAPVDNGTGARPSVVAGGWGPEVVLDDDDSMDVDQWGEDDDEQGSVWSVNKKRKRPTGLAKFMLGDDGDKSVQSGEQAAAEPLEVAWDEMVEPVILKWGSGS
ncbi:hypothetical protein BCR44DRAFT_51073 [Catenaria anguillulae PL171]|uniref:Coilin n=1 Tax=Catenaria anguillulae PL171 TaxID=765915 RepID=A0A1Y2HVD7_9FUNG|nr:hypothetical protein BCR44DRAFT_51073 [Catenaria anguillulae PL171]